MGVSICNLAGDPSIERRGELVGEFITQDKRPPAQRPILTIEIKRRKIVGIILANHMMTQLESFQIGRWNPRDTIMMRILFVMARIMTGGLITIK